MSDKLTDTEVKKALECCKKDDCDNCLNNFGNCYSNLAGYALDLLKRQQAELDKYEQIKTTLNEFWDILLKFKIAKRKEKPTLEEFAEAIGHIQDEAKSEAVKEFAERLKETLPKDDFLRSTKYISNQIDNLLKEMVGEMND